jgi:hypothetical protein
MYNYDPKTRNHRENKQLKFGIIIIVILALTISLFIVFGL